MKTIMKQETCVHCQGTNIDYGSLSLEGSDIYYDMICMDCGKEGREWYSTEYIGTTE